MKFVSILLLLISLTFSNKKSAGEKIYFKHDCNICHAVFPEVSINNEIVKNIAQKDKVKWVENYLRKKNFYKGRKHKIRFKGKKKEREILVNWLLSLGDSTSLSLPDSTADCPD